jgi:hypothetical protein
MSSNIANNMPYVRTSREFPTEIVNLTIELNRSFLETANAINARTIGLFPTTKSAITGEAWFLSGNKKQQTLRQAFNLTAIAAGASLSIPYTAPGFNQFSRIYGTCITNVPDYRPIPYASVALNANIELRVTPTNIIVNVGAGSPNIVSGLIVLEWLSQI